jgi:hypothetical protein
LESDLVDGGPGVVELLGKGFIDETLWSWKVWKARKAPQIFDGFDGFDMFDHQTYGHKVS